MQPTGDDSASWPLAKGPCDGSLRPLAAAREGSLGFGWSKASSGNSVYPIPE